ncbi:MAG: hypothetical protein L6R35_007368, partial [Caloplaca aegaea]
MSIPIEYVRDRAEMVQESAEGAHDFESVGDVPVEHREDAVAVTDPYEVPPPEGAVEHLDPGHIRDTMISQARQIASRACRTEVQEITDLLRLLHQIKDPEDRFTAFLKRTSEGSADLVEVLEA